MNMVSVGKKSALLASVMLIVACETGGSGGTAQNTTVNPLEIETGVLTIAQPELDWSPCDRGAAINRGAAIECADLLVPMDYSDPNGLTISIGIARSLANPATRQRTMLLNPGGPGAGGIGFLETFVRVADIPNSVRDSFDFVSFDPRGIGRSTAVECNASSLVARDSYPTTRADIQENLELTSEYAQQCYERVGEYLRQLGSFNVVRDMDEIRKALGLPQIDFLGFSYGTRLAALYLQTYPQHSGRFVLDGSMTPDPGLVPLVQGSLIPAQRNIETLADACTLERLCVPDDFLEQLQQRVNSVGDGPDSYESDLLLGILQFASTSPGFESFLIDNVSAYLQTGDIDELENVFGMLGLDESIVSIGDFSVATYIGVLCSDDPTRPTSESVAALQVPWNAESDLFAEANYNIVGICAGWPESVDPIPRIATNQAPASLVIGGPTDAQTPLVFAEQMAVALGAQMLFSEHDGHTTVFSGLNRCTDSAVEVFLTTGALPAFSRCSSSPSLASRNALAVRWHQPSLHLPW